MARSYFGNKGWVKDIVGGKVVYTDNYLERMRFEHKDVQKYWDVLKFEGIDPTIAANEKEAGVMRSMNRTVQNALDRMARNAEAVTPEEKRLLHELTVTRDEFYKAYIKGDKAKTEQFKRKDAELVKKLESGGGRVMFGGVGKDLILVKNGTASNTRTVPVSKLAVTDCERKGIEVMTKYLQSHGGVLPKTNGEVDQVLKVVPDIDVTEMQNVMSHFKYGRGRKFVSQNSTACNAKFKVGDKVKVAGYSDLPVDRKTVFKVVDVRVDGLVGIREYSATQGQYVVKPDILVSANARACNAKFKVGDVVKCKAGWKGRVVRIDGGTVHGYDSKFGPFEAKESDCEAVNSTACNFQAPIFGRPKVGDTVRYAGGFYSVVKDLGAGKFVLRSKTTGGTVAVTATKGLEIMEQDSVANARVACNGRGDCFANAVFSLEKVKSEIKYALQYGDRSSKLRGFVTEGLAIISKAEKDLDKVREKVDAYEMEPFTDK